MINAALSEPYLFLYPGGFCNNTKSIRSKKPLNIVEGGAIGSIVKIALTLMDTHTKARLHMKGRDCWMDYNFIVHTWG